MTPHINALKEDIAKIVIMPGDPLRAERMAKLLLNNYKLVTNVRGIVGYTGFFNNKRVTIMASGMGNPSMGIYSYELYNFYDVDYIIRVGTCGTYKDDAKLFDLILVDNSYSDSNYEDGFNMTYLKINSSDELNSKLLETAKDMNISLAKGDIHCTDNFYNVNSKTFIDKGCIGVEMETFALFTNAKYLNKHASAILTITDNLVTKDSLSSTDREISTKKMFLLALNTIDKL